MGKRGGKKAEEIEFDVRVGARVEAARRRARMTARGLARLLGVTDSQLWAYEVGKIRVPPYRLRQIARHCRIPLESLVPEL